MNLLSVTQAAKEIGVSRQSILQAIKNGRMSATRVCKSWVISSDELARYAPRYSVSRKGVGFKPKPPKHQTDDEFVMAMKSAGYKVHIVDYEIVGDKVRVKSKCQ